MDEVDRVFRHLVEVLADQHPERLNSPLQASEIYQTIIPYRRYRSALRFESNQDYEMAVLRLLAGERDYLSVEPPGAQDELRNEAESVNPNPATIRDYAAVKVFLNINLVRQILDEREAFAPPPEPDEPDDGDAIESIPISRFEVEGSDTDPEQPTEDEAPDPDGAVVEPAVDSLTEPEVEPPHEPAVEPPAPVAETLPEVPDIPVSSEPAPEAPQVPPTRVEEAIRPEPEPEPQADECKHCGEELPTGRTVIFCPYCGKNQSITECPVCGAELDVAWIFCVICGNATREI